MWFKSAKINDETLSPDDKARQLGLIYSVYRIFIGVFLIFSNYIDNEMLKLDILKNKNLFSINFEYSVLGFYLFFSVFFLISLYLWKKRTRLQLFAGFMVDIIALSLLLYSGSSKDLQVILLFVITVAASFMLLRLAHAFVITLSAVLFLVFQQVLYVYFGRSGFLNIWDVSLLSFGFFITGYISWSISQRLTVAESLANNNAKKIKRLNAINRQVIHHIASGVFVIDENGRLITINKAAEQMLRLPFLSDGDGSEHDLKEKNFEIERIIAKKYTQIIPWYKDKNNKKTMFLSLPQENEMPAKNIRLAKKSLPEYGQLIVLEDVSREESHAQKLKLSSLSELSASIAHEIRNPLASIVQAAELMQNDFDPDHVHYELCRISCTQAKRVNRIIESVMRLSNQEPPNQEPIRLQQWLSHFLRRYYADCNIESRFEGDFFTLFDPQHLERIFSNLIDNALRHTKKRDDAPDVEIYTHLDKDKQNVLVDVMDNGDGVSEKDLRELFDPFFTKSVGGTGLGLYLSRAFSEANYARLIYIHDKPKTCFRLIAPLYED